MGILATILGAFLSFLKDVIEDGINGKIVAPPNVAVIAQPDADLNKQLDDAIQADIDAGRTPPPVA